MQHCSLQLFLPHVDALLHSNAYCFVFQGLWLALKHMHVERYIFRSYMVLLPFPDKGKAVV